MAPFLLITDPDKKFLYIPIDKNASSRIKSSLFAHGWGVIDQNINKSDYNMFIESVINFSIIRDPYNRWLTGFVTFVRYRESKDFDLSLCNLLHSKHWYITLQLLFEFCNNFEFDWHTKLQCNYFDQHPDIKNINFFLFNENLCPTLNSWGETVNLGVPFTNYYINRRSNLDLVYSRLLSFLNDNPHYKEKLMNWLQPDYEFFNSIKFVSA